MTPTSLDYALTRYAVEFRRREDMGAGYGASLDLGAFVAGWYLAIHGLPVPALEIGHPARSSFAAGHREATSALAIAKNMGEKAELPNRHAQLRRELWDADIRPEWPDAPGVPGCSTACTSFDGKRCMVLGRRPDTDCEPAISRAFAALARDGVS
jgi:hypothetical protein